MTRRTMSGEDVVARYVQWDRGKWHACRDMRTACGRDVPDRVRLTVHPPVMCTRCKKADPEMVAAAEETRLRDLAKTQAGHEERRDRARRGEFTVLRCRTCGQQVSAPGPNRVCFAPDGGMHTTEAEEVEAVGPAWNGGTP